MPKSSKIAKLPLHRAAIIVADEVYQTIDGKYVIAGTYQNWLIGEPVLHIQKGLAIYLRIQFEIPGNYNVGIIMEDRSKSPAEKPLHSQLINFSIGNNSVPIELGLRTKGFSIKRPIGRLDRNHLKHVKLVINLEVDGMLLASAPLTVSFRHPKDTHVNHSNIAAPQ